jgi:Type VI secretion, TssG
MKKKKNISPFESLVQEIAQTRADIRAEVLLACCIGRGYLSRADFFTHHDAGYRRRYTKDIDFTEVSEDGSFQNWLQVHLSRNGLYDILPEGLFFQPEEIGQAVKSVPEMVEEYRNNQQQEAEIRKFFAPIEHEFFLHRLYNEQFESQLLGGLQSGLLADYFISFWNLPAGITPKQAQTLILLLPYVHVVAGDLPLTAICLQHITGEAVQVRRRKPQRQQAYEQSNVLGKFLLGNELVCGQSFAEDYPVIEFSIGPLKHSQEQQYIPGGNRYELLQVFYNYFLPVEAEVITTVLLNKDNLRSRRLEAGVEPRLGLSATL